MESLQKKIEIKIADLQQAKEDCPSKWMCRKALNRMDGEIRALTIVKQYLDDEEAGIRFSSAEPYFLLGTVWR